jgi:predicted DNA-binding WGR domain protein
MIHLRYQDEKSSKFWEIEVEGSSHTVRYGKIGTDGQTKTKEFGSPDEAQASADKLVKQKLKKGYEHAESGESEGEASDDMSAGDRLRALLGGLCDTPQDQMILDALCEAVGEASDTSFDFEESEFEYVKGTGAVYCEGVPKSFSEIAASVKELYWDGGGPEVGFGLTEEGQPAADDSGFDYLEDDSPEDYERINEAGGANPAFAYGQNWTFFDPTRTLANGEPALAFVSHEGGGWEEVKSADKLNYKQIFLRMISDAMIETDYLSELYC